MRPSPDGARPGRVASNNNSPGPQWIWPGPDLLAAYVDLRVWCMQHGHGLGQKSHEADRWIAATAMLFEVPLVTHDAVFRDVDGLELITTLRETE